ncbi:MAG: pseudouridine synthase [Chthoniobacterales bacterium]|nr:pseudouridine synthase [Chthoniobacterales bacterium]
MLLAFHKPYGCLSQFTKDGSKHKTLADFQFPPHVYPIGRLDADSEGLLLLTDERGVQEKLMNPKYAHRRCYWAQVERIPSENSLEKLREGVSIQDYQTRPARAWLLDPQPQVPPRIPPIRVRKNIPDYWITLELTEGKNRQVRHMTAAIGHPTLRLLRVSIGQFQLGDLAPGRWRALSQEERAILENQK